MKVTLPNGVTIEPTSSDETSLLISLLLGPPPKQELTTVDKLRRSNAVLRHKLKRLARLHSLVTEVPSC